MNEQIFKMQNKDNNDLFLFMQHGHNLDEQAERLEKITQSLHMSRRMTVDDVDYRDEDQRERESLVGQKPRLAINSDSEEEDSDEDDNLRAAKKVIYARNRNKSIIQSDEEFESESDY